MFWGSIAILVMSLGSKIHIEVETLEHRHDLPGDAKPLPSMPSTAPPDPLQPENDGTSWFAIAQIKDRGRTYDLPGVLSETGIDAGVVKQPRFGDQFAGERANKVRSGFLLERITLSGPFRNPETRNLNGI